MTFTGQTIVFTVIDIWLLKVLTRHTLSTLILYCSLVNRLILCKGYAQITKFMGPTWGPPWTLLSGWSCLHTLVNPLLVVTLYGIAYVLHCGINLSLSTICMCKERHYLCRMGVAKWCFVSIIQQCKWLISAYYGQFQCNSSCHYLNG